MKIGILYENKGLGNRDITKPYKGNPGISGTMWGFVSLGYWLATNYDVHVCYYMFEEQMAPEGTIRKVIDSYEHAVVAACEDKVDWFIMSNIPEAKIGGKVFGAIRRTGLKTIVRSDCFMKEYEIKQIVKTPTIKRVVCVGDWQYKHMDKRIKKRAVRLYHFHDVNAFPVSCISHKNKKKRIVMYQGMLKSGKGFHVLAKIWSYVSALVPEAELWVLGTGQLYGNHFQVGPYGLADKDYERTIMKHLTNKDGQLRSDVKFLGLQGGNAKIQYMQQAKVGVMNPTGNTETWGMSASEFELMGIPVVTRNRYGCKDSVKNFRGGFRFNTSLGFIIYLVLLLKCDSLNQKIGMAGRKRICKIANANQVADGWFKLLSEIR